MSRKKYKDAIATGYRIKIARKSKGFSMEELGEQLTPPASKGGVSNWENGYNLPNNDRLKQLSNILDVPVSYLINGDKLENIDISKIGDFTILDSHRIKRVKQESENAYFWYYLMAYEYTDRKIAGFLSVGIQYSLSRGEEKQAYMEVPTYITFSLVPQSEVNKLKIGQKFYDENFEIDLDSFSGLITNLSEKDIKETVFVLVKKSRENGLLLDGEGFFKYKLIINWLNKNQYIEYI